MRTKSLAKARREDCEDCLSAKAAPDEAFESPASTDDAFDARGNDEFIRRSVSGVAPVFSNARAFGIQAKLEVGASDDPLEEEADRIAEAIASSPASAGSEASKEILRPKAQGGGNAGFSVSGESASAINAALSSGGSPLPASTREAFESRMGADFSGVRIHTGIDAAASAKLIGATAYSFGRDIVFGEGRYSPGSQEGRKLLAHELAHFIQGGTALRRTTEVPVSQESEPWEYEDQRSITTEDLMEEYLQAPDNSHLVEIEQRLQNKLQETQDEVTLSNLWAWFVGKASGNKNLVSLVDEVFFNAPLKVLMLRYQECQKRELLVKIEKRVNDQFARVEITEKFILYFDYRGVSGSNLELEKAISRDKDIRVCLAMDFLVDLGIDPERAAGLVGNLIAESGMEPTMLVGGKLVEGRVVGGNLGAVGLPQWRGERKRALLEFLKAAAGGINWESSQLESNEKSKDEKGDSTEVEKELKKKEQREQVLLLLDNFQGQLEYILFEILNNRAYQKSRRVLFPLNVASTDEGARNEAIKVLGVIPLNKDTMSRVSEYVDEIEKNYERPRVQGKRGQLGVQAVRIYNEWLKVKTQPMVPGGGE